MYIAAKLSIIDNFAAMSAMYMNKSSNAYNPLHVSDELQCLTLESFVENAILF